MAEPLARVLMVIGAAVVGVTVGLVIPRLRARRLERAPLDLSGVEGEVILLTSEGCPSCVRAREVLEALRVAYVEVSHDADPESFAATGASSVPVIVVRDGTGGEVGRIAGVPSARRVRSLVGRAGRITKRS